MQWSESLTKISITDDVFDASLGPEETALLAPLRELCRGRVDTADRVKEIKAALKTLPMGAKLPKAACEAVASLKEELAEIAKDLRFAKSRRGKYVLFMQDYVQRLYRTLRQHPRFADVYVGGHTEREIILVHGKVQSPADLEDLKAMLASEPSGLPEEYLVKVMGA